MINSELPYVVAYYLPQFHRLKFNDDYWGKGFTEWTNTIKAKPLFKGHYQPHIPADLGFYDLNMQSTRRAQASMAQEYGLGGFCYWHYWLSENNQVMEMPFNEVIKDKEITLPFCLAWANHDWHNVKTREVIIKQKYGGVKDYESHYEALRHAFLDNRYLKLSGKPIFVVFSPFEIPDLNIFFTCWNNMARNDGLDGFYFIAIIKRDVEIQKALGMGYDAVNIMRLQEFEYHRSFISNYVYNIKRKWFHSPYKFDFEDVMKFFTSEMDYDEQVIPTIISGWDHTPRSGKNALILDNFTPSVFYNHVRDVFQHLKNKHNKMVFVRAWNEWAEGNYLEPDLKYGHGYLKAIKKNLEEFND